MTSNYFYRKKEVPCYVDVTVSVVPFEGRKEMFYLTTHSAHFILRLYGVGHMVKDHSDSERGNPLPPHGSNGSFICTIPQTG